MKTLLKLFVIAAVFSVASFPFRAVAQSVDEIDAALSDYAAFVHENTVMMSSSCDKKLNDTGTGSTCSCSATGSGSTCICSGSGNQKVCSCSDGTSTTYCYFCGNGSGCECGPTNRSGQPCKTVTRIAVGDSIAMK